MHSCIFISDNKMHHKEFLFKVCKCVYLNPSMAAQVEVELGRVCDGAVHRGACWDVTALPHLQQRINQITFKILQNNSCTIGKTI